MCDDTIVYLGCIRVNTSMRELLETKRLEVARESIKRLRRVNKLINIDSDDDDNDDRLSRSNNLNRFNDVDLMLDDEPDLRYQGTEVGLRVTNGHLEMISKKTDQSIVQHAMRDVSFACNCDEGTIDYAAYIAKNHEFGRACFVLQCAHGTGNLILEEIAFGFRPGSKKISPNTLPRTHPGFNHSGTTNLFHTSDLQDTVSDDDASSRLSNENDQTQRLIALTREYLEKEPWFHGSELSRDQSESRLKQDGDFLVRESQIKRGQFVLSVMQDGTKLHLWFDSVGQVKTKESTFDDISHLIRFHHDQGSPLVVAKDRLVYLRNGVSPKTD